MKMIKFDLQINGVKITNIEELQDNFSVEILPIFNSGLLAKWLKSRELIDQARSIEEIDKNTIELIQLKKICQALEIDDDDEILQFMLDDRKTDSNQILEQTSEHAIEPKNIRTTETDKPQNSNNKQYSNENLIGFISTAIEQNKSKIIPLLKTKTGEFSIAALRDDNNIEKLSTYLYSFLPGVVKFAITDQIFHKFIMENRTKIIDLIQLDKSDSLETKILDKILTIQRAQKNDKEKWAAEIYSELIDGKANRNYVDTVWLFILDSHIKLVNINLDKMGFITHQNDIKKCTALAQFITVILCLYCTSKIHKSVFENIGEKRYYQIAGIALGYYDMCEKNNADFNTIDPEVYKTITGILGKPDHEENSIDIIKAKQGIVLDFLEEEPINLPRDIGINLLAKSEEIYLAWLTKVSEM